MASRLFSRTSRPLVGALGTVPFVHLHFQPTRCEETKPTFQPATCVKNEVHTHNTRMITLQLGAAWTQKGPIANVAVKAHIAGALAQGEPAESGCCACCKCPQPCGCPKQANGCCACCSCPGTCGCPKQAGPGSTSVTKPYNPISIDSGSTITLLVKRYENARMGTAMHNLKEGESVEVRGPNQQWTWTRGQYQKYAMVAGGTGITPLFQAARHILKNDTATVTFTTFNKTPHDVLLKKELEELAAQYPGRLEISHCVEGGEGYQQAGCEQAGKCCFPRVLKTKLPPPGDGLLVMVCGPMAMTKHLAGPKAKDFTQGELEGVLKDLGYESQHVWKV